VPYERRYYDAKFESGNFLLRNVVITVIGSFPARDTGNTNSHSV